MSHHSGSSHQSEDWPVKTARRATTPRVALGFADKAMLTSLEPGNPLWRMLQLPNSKYEAALFFGGRLTKRQNGNFAYYLGSFLKANDPQRPAAGYFLSSSGP